MYVGLIYMSLTFNVSWYRIDVRYYDVGITHSLKLYVLVRATSQVAEHSAHPSFKTRRALLSLTACVTLASAARINLAATPDTFSSLLKFWQVDSDPNLSPQNLKANQKKKKKKKNKN
jgi:hypothetical protein